MDRVMIFVTYKEVYSSDRASNVLNVSDWIFSSQPWTIEGTHRFFMTIIQYQFESSSELVSSVISPRRLPSDYGSASWDGI